MPRRAAVLSRMEWTVGLRLVLLTLHVLVHRGRSCVMARRCTPPDQQHLSHTRRARRATQFSRFENLSAQSNLKGSRQSNEMKWPNGPSNIQKCNGPGYYQNNFLLPRPLNIAKPAHLRPGRENARVCKQTRFALAGTFILDSEHACRVIESIKERHQLLTATV